jgi:hypothetical protein
VRRRELLVAAAAAVLARPAAAAAAGTGEAEVLIELARLEGEAALAHRRAAIAPLMAAHAAAHANALGTEIAALGRRAPAQPDDVGALQGPARALAQARPAGQVDAAIELEQSLAAACRRALGEIDAPGILQTVATILASHAQHRVLLLRAAGLGPLS